MNALSPGFGGLLARASRAAKRRQHRLSTAHILLEMFQGDREVARLLSAAQVTEASLLGALTGVEEEHDTTVDRVVRNAQRIAADLADEPRPVHLLLAIVRDRRSAGHRGLETVQAGTAEALYTQGLSALLPRELRSKTRRVSPPLAPRGERRPADRGRAGGRTNRRVQRDKPPQPAAQAAPEPPTSDDPAPAPAQPAAAAAPDPYALAPKRFPLLSRWGRNLSQLAAEGALDPVVGRELEIEQLLDVLGRRRANNPVLVGPSGVGKTAIVEGLAQALAAANHDSGGPSPRVIVELSAGALVCGTGVRGALAERLEALCKEVRRSEGRVLLFIDEIHALIGPEEGPDSVANELKAALARGELPCIGATTDGEYRRVFERDPALARRFTRVQVEEPEPEVAREILRGVALTYEKHHGVAYASEALDAAVDMAVRYVPERKLPDKAIGIIDQAAARVRRRGGSCVATADVAEVVAELAKVPLERLTMRDGDQMLRLEQHLQERVIGQERASARIAAALRKGAAGFRGSRPLSTFLFLGPTGVGKTEMAKAIAELLFPGSRPVRFDMSEFSEAHSVARLCGAPPGYLGHDEGGQLTEAVRARPYQLVLLDEVEKAHPDVLMALLPLLDEGRLTDGRGRTVDFTNTVIVMTSNLGASSAPPRGRLGFGAGDGPSAGDERGDRALAAARQALPPELFNRIDEPLYFRPLSPEHVRAIARLLVGEVREVMRAEHGIELEIADSALDVLVSTGGYDPTLGARPMRRQIGRLLEAPLAAAVLERRFARDSVVCIEGSEGALRMDARAADDAAQ